MTRALRAFCDVVAYINRQSACMPAISQSSSSSCNWRFPRNCRACERGAKQFSFNQSHREMSSLYQRPWPLLTSSSWRVARKPLLKQSRTRLSLPGVNARNVAMINDINRRRPAGVTCPARRRCHGGYSTILEHKAASIKPINAVVCWQNKLI